MTTVTPASVDAATHRQLAVDLFNHVWTLLETADRTPAPGGRGSWCSATWRRLRRRRPRLVTYQPRRAYGADGGEAGACCEPLTAPAAAGSLTRCCPARLSPVRLVRGRGTNARTPVHAVRGSRMNERTDPPRTSRDAKSSAWSAMRRRTVLPSISTSAGTTLRGRQPRWTAMRRASRTFVSSEPIVACTSQIPVFTSVTSKVALGAWNASRSTRPRSP